MPLSKFVKQPIESPIDAKVPEAIAPVAKLVAEEKIHVAPIRDAKDTRISRQGLYQAALQCMAASQFAPEATLDSFLETVQKIADKGLEYVNR